MFSGGKLGMGPGIGSCFNNPDIAWGWLRSKMVAWKQKMRGSKSKAIEKRATRYGNVSRCRVSGFQDAGVGRMVTNEGTQVSKSFREVKQRPISSLQSYLFEWHPKWQAYKRKLHSIRAFKCSEHKLGRPLLQKQTRCPGAQPWLWQLREA